MPDTAAAASSSDQTQQTRDAGEGTYENFGSTVASTGGSIPGGLSDLTQQSEGVSGGGSVDNGDSSAFYAEGSGVEGSSGLGPAPTEETDVSGIVNSGDDVFFATSSAAAEVEAAPTEEGEGTRVSTGSGRGDALTAMLFGRSEESDATAEEKEKEKEEAEEDEHDEEKKKSKLNIFERVAVAVGLKDSDSSSSSSSDDDDKDKDKHTETAQS